ncbi:tryptophan 2,3-dioxygenase [Lentinula raphanica]|nr:tryptophan 2,3-dioxygenase [Lentinula raphanica]
MELDPSHFLSLPRPSGSTSLNGDSSVVDTTTLAAHDFDVDPRTGFMPPHPPLERLPDGLDGMDYVRWEEALKDAMGGEGKERLQLGDRKAGLTKEEKERNDEWRERVKNLPMLEIRPLLRSELMLRRAHHVLAWILHFYVHSISSPQNQIRIPPPLSVPLLQVCREMQMPPVLTYSDDVLYNWALMSSSTIDPNNLRILSSFTGTPSESHFYLTSARIELIGVGALALMQSTLDELFVGDQIAVRRITGYLSALGTIIAEMEVELKKMPEGCDPSLFYEHIRPWFRGIDFMKEEGWVFEGLEADSALEQPTELSGPSAGQSSLIHALDVFLGVHEFSHKESNSNSFLSRMQSYMPRHHRNFLSHLQSQNTRRSLRALVFDGLDQTGGNGHATMDDGRALLEAYNSAVFALKKFRDAHFVIVARYIIGPAAAVDRPTAAERASLEDAPLKGTGGTDLARFLKGVRDSTREAIIDL